MPYQRPFLFALSFIICLSSHAECLQEPTKKVLVNVKALPEPFSNENLPQTGSEPESREGEVCYSLMGCYIRIPIVAPHANPMSLKTSFKIIHKSEESVVRVETLENCLESNPAECDRYPFDLQQVKDSPFQINRRTIVIIGGYRSKAGGNWETKMRNLWPNLDDVNVIVVDWDYSNDGLYNTAAANTRPVARQTIVLLYYLAKMKGGPDLDLNDDAYVDKFYLVGHSLGAHVAGFVGRDLAGRLGRITGLDPAGPMFDPLDSQFRIDRSDARFVDIIHSNSGSKIFALKSQFGSSLASGHIDLWANNGQHQPGCSNEMSGCSHKRSIKFYESFLNDMLSMRTYLGNRYRPMYRLRAYRSDTYQAFHEGSSLAEHCPISSFDDNDLDYADLAQCSIPVDYLSWYSDYKKELQTVHGLDFTETVTTNLPNNFYFYTNGDVTDLQDHYSIKIRISKPSDDNPEGEQGKNEGFSAANDCSINVDIAMANELDNNYNIDKYHLFDMKDHYEILFPFLAPNSISKYEIAKLDSEDFFVERQKETGKEIVSPANMASLRRALYQVFPKSVTLRGFKDQERTTDRKKGGVFDSIKRFFKGDSSNRSDGDETGERSHGVNCELPIESFIVQPLRKFRRHLSAFYSHDCSNNDPHQREVNVILLGENEPTPRAQLSNEAASAGDCDNLEADGTMTLQLRTLIIGPTLTIEREELEENVLQGSDSTLIANNSHYLDEPGVQKEVSEAGGKPEADAKLWLVLTVLLLIIVLALVAVSVPAMRRASIDKILSKQTMVMINTNQATLVSR